MTLEEALRGHDWIPDLADSSRARIAGPDNRAAIMVEEGEDGCLTCWLWSALVHGQLGDVVLETDPDHLEDTLATLGSVRQQTGDCPLCSRPLHPMVDGAAQCVCGYRREVGEVEATHVSEMQEVAA